MRQIHHWAALLFVASIGLHMLRIFFTGAFRKPRELNWVIGFVLFILAMAEGFTGYSLPDDLLSGNGLRIIDGLVKGLPVVGTWISFLLFGGEFPGTAIVGRLYTLHILLLPALVVAFIALHLMFVVIHKHTQYAGPGPHAGQRRRLPGPPGVRGEGRRLLLHRVRCHRAHGVVLHDQPDLELRPVRPLPGVRRHPAGLVHRLRGRRPASRAAGLGVRAGSTAPGRSTSSSRSAILGSVHRDASCSTRSSRRGSPATSASTTSSTARATPPTRTAIGAAGVTFYAVLWAAASSDIIATHFKLTMEGVIHTLQALLFLGPLIAYFVTKRVCLALQKKDRAIALHGYESRPHREAARRRVHRGARAARRLRALAPGQLRRLRAADDPPEPPRQDHGRAPGARRPVPLVLRGPHRRRRRTSELESGHDHH